MLDNMDLERERGITIKSHAIQMEYKHNGETYILNLIDTPGHVDFSYEVSRSIAACEGALLVVDATQGVQAQTISNLYMAIEHDLEIIPVLNKIDMPSAMPDEVEDEIVELIGCKREDILRASGKTGEGVDDVLRAIVERVPHPTGDPKAPLQALIFDSVFNSFRGIIAYFKIENGEIRKGDKVKFFNTGMEYVADEVGVLHGARTFVLQDRDGQTKASHSISAGLDYPGVGPQHAWLARSGRASYMPVSDAEAMDAFLHLSRTEGIIPAIESSHALAGVRAWARAKSEAEGPFAPGEEPIAIVTVSGRGDKDVDTASRWFGYGHAKLQVIDPSAGPSGVAVLDENEEK